MNTDLKHKYPAVVKGFADVVRRNEIDVLTGITATTLARFLCYQINNLLENNLSEFELEEDEIDENGDINYNR